MGGTFTTTLKRPKKLKSLMRSIFGVISKDPAWVTLASSTVTTSFRTGRGRRKSDEELIESFTRTQFNPFRDGFRDTIDNGHEFKTQTKRQSYSHQSYTAWSTTPGQQDLYTGPLSISTSGGTPNWPSNYPSVAYMTDNEVAFHGLLALNATAPNQPSANVATTIGELFRDGIPDISVLLNSVTKAKASSSLGRVIDKRKRIDGSTAGGEFLNYQFGWRPLINDVNQILHAVIKVSETLNQYVRDGQPGRIVRRHWDYKPSIPESSSTRVKLVDQATLAIPGSGSRLYIQPLSDVYQWDTSNTRYWASLAYSYFVNIDSDLFSRMDRYANEAQKLLGLGLTPEVIWDLAPFSWLVDWKVDFGSAIGVATKFQDDDLVLRWGYLMRRVDAVRTFTLDDIRFKSGSPGSIRNSWLTTTKERRRISPYGFPVLNESDLTAAQWAILAAMGLTKANRVMW
jgi:hypothetical protein